MAILAEVIVEIIKVAVFFAVVIGCIVLGKIMRSKKDKKDSLKQLDQTED